MENFFPFIFLRGLFKDIDNDIPMCQKCKYKNTVYDKVPERSNTSRENCSNILSRTAVQDLVLCQTPD